MATPLTFRDLQLEFIATEQQGPIAYIKLNRPPVNAHHMPMLLDLERAILAVRFDPSVKVAIVTSQLPRYFSAGADIRVIRDEDPEQVGLLSQTSKEILQRMRTTAKIFIAGIDGHCMGGGLEIALACDYRIASNGPWQFGLPEVQLGVLPGEGGTQLLGRLIGPHLTLRLSVSGESFGVQKAHELGIVDEVYEPEAYASSLQAFAERIAQGPTRAIGFIKMVINEGLDLPLQGGFALERELQNQLLRTEDVREGVTAFLERRPPRFRGR
uniref:Crotonase n=1 Tax=Thermogemmatispora argillosa TaxID=2045280 RepID=A0A455SWR1_9CHLR|nr:crotonase [Thermogemmatispora argillosa]